MAPAVRLARIISGFVLIGAGMVGWFLPVVPGNVLIAAGLLLLAPDFPWARRILHWVRQRWEQAKGSRTTSEH